MEYDLIIIGAGAAGLFAAANVPDDLKTLVLEKEDSPGKKLLLTGNGQCNLTNDKKISEFTDHYGKNGKRLRCVLYPFSNLFLIKYLKQNGLPVTTREDGKVFPASMKSLDVLNYLLKQIRSRDIKINYNSAVVKLEYKDNFIIHTNDNRFISKYVIVVTGGLSYPKTGSDGKFFTCLEQLGLNLVPQSPALTPIYVENYPYNDLSGLTFEKCKIEITFKDGKYIENTMKNLLFTHKGFSGPAILDISRYVSQGDMLSINYMPQISFDNLRADLIKVATGNPVQIDTLLTSVTGLPRSFLKYICKAASIDPSKKASQLTGSEMNAIITRLTEDNYKVNDIGDFNIAMVTAGGVDLDEVDLYSMEAKNINNLFFAGEVLDVDGDTGGYNLQFAFSSAMLCVKTIQNNLMKIK